LRHAPNRRQGELGGTSGCFGLGPALYARNDGELRNLINAANCLKKVPQESRNDRAPDAMSVRVCSRQFDWWVLTGSNRRHSPCKGDPTEQLPNLGQELNL
jgi:hypothetical protein